METGAGEDHGASTVVTESTPTANYNENQNQAVQPVNICEPKLNSSSSVSVFTTQLISVTDTESTDSVSLLLHHPMDIIFEVSYVADPYMSSSYIL